MINYLKLSMTLLIIFGTFSGKRISAEEPLSAEYAFRWQPIFGGPQTLKQISNALNADFRFKDEFKITYHNITNVVKDIDGSFKIFRERTSKSEKKEFRIKYRKTTPINNELSCPISLDSSYEKDVTFISIDSTTSAYSFSCTGNQNGIREMALADKSNESIFMKRYESNKLRLEIWTLQNGEFFYEVSHRDKNTKKTYRKFQKTVNTLVSLGAKAMISSKSEIGLNFAK